MADTELFKGGDDVRLVNKYTGEKVEGTVALTVEAEDGPGFVLTTERRVFTYASWDVKAF